MTRSIWSARRNMRAGYFAIPFALALTGCATTTDTGGTDAVMPVTNRQAICSAFVPLPWSTRDTDETIAAVKEHNAAWKAICGKETDDERPGA